MAREAILTKQLPVAMSPEMYDQIKDAADGRRVSMGEVVRDWIDSALSPQS